MLSTQLRQNTLYTDNLICCKKWNIHSKIKCRHDQIDLCQYIEHNLILWWGFCSTFTQTLKAEIRSDASQIQQKELNSQTESTRYTYTARRYLEICSSVTTKKDENIFFNKPQFSYLMQQLNSRILSNYICMLPD